MKCFVESNNIGKRIKRFDQDLRMLKVNIISCFQYHSDDVMLFSERIPLS